MTCGEVICGGGRLLWPVRFNHLRHGSYGYRVTVCGDTVIAGTATVVIGPVTGASRSEWRQLNDGSGVMLLPGPLKGSMTFTGPLTDAGLHFAHRYRMKGWARCRQCNPRGNPAPLPGGRGYRKRQLARRRRR